MLNSPLTGLRKRLRRLLSLNIFSNGRRANGHDAGTRFEGLAGLEPRVLLTNAPTFVTALEDQFMTNSGALTIGVDATDLDGDNITVTAVSDNPNLKTFIPQGNRWARMHFTEQDGVTPIGAIELEIFETRGGLNAERFITLATNAVAGDGTLDPNGTPFYSDVPLHRVISDFMVQTGDAENGNGTGGSPLGDFPDRFDPFLSFMGPGALAAANSGANTNDSQFFVTDVPTPWLDQRHVIFGQMVSGQGVYDEIINRPVDSGDAPVTPMFLDRIEIFENHQDATITFMPTGAIPPEGLTANVTVTLDDGDGNLTQQTIAVTMLGIDAPNIVTVNQGEEVNFNAILNDIGASVSGQVSSSVDSVTPTWNTATGEVSFTTPADFQGVIELTFEATRGTDQITAVKTVAVNVEDRPELPAVGYADAKVNGQAFASTQIGNLLYTAEGVAGIGITDISTPDAPIFLGGFDTRGQARNLVVEQGADDRVIAYVADTNGGVSIIDVSDPTQPVILSELDLTSAAVSLDKSGDFIFVAEFSEGLTAINVSDPSNPTIVSTIKGELLGAVDVRIEGNFAYVSDLDDAAVADICIFDITDPANMALVGGLQAGGSVWGIDINDNRLFVAAQGTAGAANPADQDGSISIFDLSASLTAPPLLGTFPSTNGPWQVEADGNTLVAGLTNVNGFDVLDISDPTNPQLIDTIDGGDIGGRPNSVNGQFVLPIFGEGFTIADLGTFESFGGGLSNAIQVDVSGVLHLAYHDINDGSLKYVTRSAGNAWGSPTLIDAGSAEVGIYVVMALDSNGLPGVAYYDAFNGDLKYAKFDGTNWQVEAVQTRRTVGLYPSIQFDAADNPVITYYHKSNGNLLFATKVGGAWNISEIDTQDDVGRYSSLQRNPNTGLWAVSYENTTTGEFRYAEQAAGNTWDAVTFDPTLGGGGFTSLAFDPSGNPTISYYDAFNADLKVAFRASGDWFPQTVASKRSQGLYTNIFFTGTTANVTYFNKTSDSLVRATNSGGGWDFSTLATGGGRWGRVTIMTDGRLAYSWWESFSQNVVVEIL